MNIFKEASRLNLRIPSSKGELTVENLWQLTIPQLDAMAVKLENEFEASGGKSFVTKKSEKDRIAKLRFDIVLEILTDKVEASEAARTAGDKKQHNEKILAIIARKEEEKLGASTVEELKALLQD